MVKLTFKRDHSGSNMKGKERQRGRRKRGRKMSGADSWHNVPKHHFFFPPGGVCFLPEQKYLAIEILLLWSKAFIDLLLFVGNR